MLPAAYAIIGEISAIAVVDRMFWAVVFTALFTTLIAPIMLAPLMKSNRA